MKKILVLFLALLMCLSLFACGGDRYDVGHDENGFLGYSDDFWDWYARNN